MNIFDNTKEEIQKILQDNFKPSIINVINESEAHKNHIASLSNPKAGHFKIILKSAFFNNKTPIERHRMVYDKLSHLMDSRIHALSLDLSQEN